MNHDIYPVIMKDVFFAGIAIKLKSVVNREQKKQKEGIENA